MANVLIADDEMIMRTVLKKHLRKEGYDITEATNGEEAIEQIKSRHFDVIILDNKMPVKSGCEVLQFARAVKANSIIILMTAYASIKDAVNIMRLGADDYTDKPFDLSVLSKTIQQHLSAKERSATFVPQKEAPAENIVGTSPSIKNILNTIDKIKNLNTTILITGESGTGKGVVAKEIHQKSNRKNAPFIHVDCSALNPNLIESELFGHEKGAFTSANSQKIGKFELAENGTLFLDEIGNLPLSLQTKLLLVLEERSFYRVGGTKLLPLNARIIAATNSNLSSEVTKGTFREDLYNSIFLTFVPWSALCAGTFSLIGYTENYFSVLPYCFCSFASFAFIILWAVLGKFAPSWQGKKEA